jgi:ferredoxin
MVVQLQQPCRARYQRRSIAWPADSAPATPTFTAPDVGSYRVCVDLDLCQGHGVCVDEAPDVFGLDPVERKVTLRVAEPGEDARDEVELAVRHCPTRALSIEE